MVFEFLISQSLINNKKVVNLKIFDIILLNNNMDIIERNNLWDNLKNF